MSLSSLKGDLIAHDTETTGLNSWGSYARYGFYPARPFAFSFCDTKGNTAYIRWEVNPKTRQVIPEKKSKRAMSEILRDPNIVKVGHNLTFDIRMNRMSGIRFDWSRIHDTQILAHVFTGGSLFAYGLKPLGKLWLDIDDDDQEDLLDSVRSARRKAKKLGWKIATKETHGGEYIKSDYWLGDRKLCKDYALGDSKRTMLLCLGLLEEIKKDPELYSIYLKEIELIRVMYRVERNGVRVFKGHLRHLRKFYGDYSDRWLKIAERNGSNGMNFNSPKQLVQKFCVEKKYKTAKRTKTGQPSMDNAELERLAKKDKLAKAILEYKAGYSMITKFINAYEKFMVKEGDCWVLHPNFRQIAAVTGRMSCSDPNLMGAATEDSVKRKADIGLKPREALGPRKGCMWYLPDFSQMEVWAFAFQAKDKIMMKALLSGKDFHEITAAYIWGTEPDFKEQAVIYRKKGKTTMFIKQYGGTAKALAELMNCTRWEAQEVIDKFDERLPGVNIFIEKIMRKVETEDFIRNVFGRKYIIPPRFSYRGVNYLVQGACADILKNALIGIDALFKKKWKGCKILIPLHDEIILEIPKALHCEMLQRDIIKIMQKDSAQLGLPVKLPVTMKFTSTRWSDAKEL